MTDKPENKMPEPARALDRMMKITIIIALVSVIAFVSARYLSPNGETACPPGERMVRVSPPAQTKRFVCKKIEEVEDAENQ